jgi:N-acetylglucosamine kinase-like BadF-type ATPase
MDVLLGVDGGNSKTIALVAQRDGTILGCGRAACSDMYNLGALEPAMVQITAAVRQALAMAGLPAAVPVAGGFSLAGADWPEDFPYLQNALAPLAREVVVVNDALGALRAGSPDGTGVGIACGTGAAIGARSATGQVWHTSFWQEPQGGEQLAQKMLRAVYRADLGLDPPTTLTSAVLRHFDQPTVEAVLHLLTGRDQPRPSLGHIARLARCLLDEAQRGDSTALRIIQDHGASLGDYALVAARRVGLIDTSFPLVLAGGVLRHPSPLLAEAIAARVLAAAPGARPLASRFEPAVGALFLAFDAAGIPVDEPFLETLVPTLPAAALFDT